MNTFTGAAPESNLETTKAPNLCYRLLVMFRQLLIDTFSVLLKLYLRVTTSLYLA